MERSSPGGERSKVDSDAVKGEIDHQNDRAVYYHEKRQEREAK